MPPTPDLLSLVLILRPLAFPAPPLPAWWGRAAHSLLLRTVALADPALAESLHQESGLRPFAVSSLLGPFPRAGFDPQAPYTLRLGALQADLSKILLQASEAGGTLAPGAVLELDELPLRVEQALCQPEQHPWAASASYADLAARKLVSAEPAERNLALQFTSPTAFKTQGHHLPLPLPGLVFGSLLERWNACAPIAFPPEVKRYAEECLAINRFDLQSRPVPAKSGGLRIGFTGQVGYTALHYDRYWMSVLHTLAAFALFSSVGAGTSQGLGQCRAVSWKREEGEPSHGSKEEGDSRDEKG